MLTIDFKPGSCPRHLDRDDFAQADPCSVRFGILTNKGVQTRYAGLTIELQPKFSLARAEKFFISLKSAFSNSTIWPQRHQSSYWSIAPAGIPNFRRLQAILSAPDFDERFHHADLRAYTLRMRVAQAIPRTITTSLYLQLIPDSAYMLLSRNAYQPVSLLFSEAS